MTFETSIERGMAVLSLVNGSAPLAGRSTTQRNQSILTMTGINPFTEKIKKDPCYNLDTIKDFITCYAVNLYYVIMKFDLSLCGEFGLWARHVRPARTCPFLIRTIGRRRSLRRCCQFRQHAVDRCGCRSLHYRSGDERPSRLERKNSRRPARRHGAGDGRRRGHAGESAVMEAVAPSAHVTVKRGTGECRPARNERVKVLAAFDPRRS